MLPPTSRAPSPAYGHAVIALTSAAVVVYEVGVTRLLSVVLWYHFAFLAISLALLGIGAPGVWMALRPPGPKLLARALLLASLALPASVVLIVKVAAPLGLGSTLALPALKLAVVVVAVLAPLVCLGFAVCALLLSAREGAVGRMYGADLLGGALGALCVVPLLDGVATPLLLALTGLLPLAGCALTAAGDKRARAVCAAVAAAVLGAVAWGAPFHLTQNKSYDEAKYVPLFERWTSTARLTLLADTPYRRAPGQAWGWGFGAKFPGAAVEERWIEQDGSAGTPVDHFSGDPAEAAWTAWDVTTVAHQLRPPKDVCVIGAGGGRDILSAKAAGAEHIDAVELHPETIGIVTDVLRGFSGNPYHLPGVVAHAGEGRSFLTRSDGQWDLVQISLIDSWAATAAGAYALSESYLYTVESLRQFLAHVRPAGFVSVTRWSRGPAQLEVPRLVLMAQEALSAEHSEPLRHIAVVRSGAVATVLLSPTALGEADIARLDGICAARGFVREWPPASRDAESVLIDVLSDQGAALAQKGFDVSPSTDDRPFFFERVRAFTPVSEADRERYSPSEQASSVIQLLTAGVALLTALLFFAPFALRPLRRGPGFWRGSAYFVLIGLGFMWIEAPLIQRFILFLGHPSYATTAVLSTLLLGTGAGAATASRLRLTSIARFRFALPLVVVASIAAYPLLLHGLGLALPARLALTAIFTVPLGVVLGFAFPVGMTVFGDEHRAWFWALNGAASVVATVTAVSAASYVGLTGVLALGAAAYLVACLLPRPRDSQ